VFQSITKGEIVGKLVFIDVNPRKVKNPLKVIGVF
jgi:hypothetical protein